jgi:multidrug efflux pump subunit AcrA (membrane-fusion protein)
MDRIIRSNAVETSSQSGSLEINLQDVHPYYALTPEMASIYGGSVASPGAVFSELPTIQTGITSTSNYSTSLQKVLEQRPSIVPHLILLGGLVFFATVLVWVCTGKIQQVSQVQGKVAPSQQLYQLQPQEFGKVVKIAVKQGQQVKAGQVVAELDTKPLADDLQVKKQQLQQIKALLDQTRQTPAQTAVMAIASAKEKTTARNVVTPQTPLVDKQQLLTQLQTQVTELQVNITKTQNLLNKSQVQLKPKSLYAPIDGVVSSLNIRSTGEEVKPKQIIAEIAPIHASGVLLLILPSQKAAFVNKGDLVEIKLNFDSQRLNVAKTQKQSIPSYRNNNILSGRVVSVSRDAQTDKRLGWVRRVEIALDSNQTVNFTPGQVVTAEIIHHRRIADMFLRPMKELQNSESD